MMKRALIIEDDQSHQYIYRLLARKQECLSDIVADGQSALDAIQRTQYDLIILDLKIPALDGFQVLGYLSEHRPDALRRTVVVSALRDKTLDMIRETYGIPVLLKPFDIETVSEYISDMLAAPLA